MEPQDITNKITAIDKDLSLLRSAWMEADPEKKNQWYDLINAKLDERLVLMAQRDATLVSE